MNVDAIHSIYYFISSFLLEKISFCRLVHLLMLLTIYYMFVISQNSYELFYFAAFKAFEMFVHMSCDSMNARSAAGLLTICNVC